MVDPLPYSGEPPTMWLRVGARFFDALLVVLLPSIVISLPYLTFEPDSTQLADLPRWAQVVLVALPLAYESLFLAWRGATPGKMLFGIAVYRYADGGKLAPYQAGLRVLLPGLGGVLGLLISDPGTASLVGFIEPMMYLPAVFHPLGRGWHDRAAGSIVLKVRR